MKRKQVGILLFDDVEVLDFCGPFEVFSVTRLNEEKRREELSPFNLLLVAATKEPVVTTGGMKVLPHHDLDDCPPLDVLVVPGGWGTRKEMDNDRLLKWIAERSRQVETLTSVCTGALLLGKAGLLDGKRATTHWRSLDWMQELFPRTTVEKHLHFVDEGALFTSAGISAGIDMALKVVSRYYGEVIARATAKHMEYPFPESNARRIALAEPSVALGARTATLALGSPDGSPVAPPPAPCLLLIDVQQGFDDPSLGSRNNPEAEANIARLLSAWREFGHPIVHVQHRSSDPASALRPGQPGVDFKPEALPRSGEPVYAKSVNSAFIGTTLEGDLRSRGLDTLVIAGLTTDHCVSTTTRMAGNLGFRVWLVDDACATFDRSAPGGEYIPANEVHRVALASLHNEFATVAPTDVLLSTFCIKSGAT